MIVVVIGGIVIVREEYIFRYILGMRSGEIFIILGIR